MKQIAWVIKYKNGAPERAVSHCKLKDTGGIGRQQLTFRGKLQWVKGEDNAKCFNQGQVYTGSVLMSDEVIMSTADSWDDFMGENIFLFL